MSLNANLIKELREKSGAGIVDCKNALMQNDNDVDKSIDWLRKKGLSVAAKKSGRVAAEGLVGAYISKNEACLIETNSETDFVSRNEKFQKFVTDCSKIALTTDGNLNSTGNTDTKGESGTNKNLPPYHALCYIMKT